MLNSVLSAAKCNSATRRSLKPLRDTGNTGLELRPGWIDSDPLVYVGTLKRQSSELEAGKELDGFLSASSASSCSSLFRSAVGKPIEQEGAIGAENGGFPGSTQIQ